MLSETQQDLMKQIPKVDLLIAGLPDKFKQHKRTKAIVQAVIEQLRMSILENQQVDLSMDFVIESIIKRLTLSDTPSLKRVVNATGIILHTNLGRAVLSKSVMQHLTDTMTHYNTLEFDLETGSRGSRYQHIEDVLCRLTGAEGALVVNNNAAAVMLILNTLAKDKEVVISRGELVEIGGSFRIPQVMAASQSKMVEVGTTNKTHLSDYEQAIHSETSMVLKVHTSNYKVLGFTESVSRSDLAQLAHDKGVTFYEDLGSGILYPMDDVKNLEEPLISECIKQGCDLVSFSGDKLLGASQAGIILGKRKLIDQIKKNQLLRAFRIDKLSLAVLEATLLQYEKDDDEIPTRYMMGLSESEILENIHAFVALYSKQLERLKMSYEIIPMSSEIGGGALPLETLPSYGIAIKSSLGINKLQAQLRQNEVPVIATIKDDALLFNFRTLFEEDYYDMIRALEKALL